MLFSFLLVRYDNDIKKQLKYYYDSAQVKNNKGEVFRHVSRDLFFC